MMGVPVGVFVLKGHRNCEMQFLGRCGGELVSDSGKMFVWGTLSSKGGNVVCTEIENEYLWFPEKGPEVHVFTKKCHSR